MRLSTLSLTPQTVIQADRINIYMQVTTMTESKRTYCVVVGKGFGFGINWSQV